MILALCLFALLSRSAAAATENVTIEEYLQKLSTVPEVTSRRDPFVVPMAPYQLELGERNGSPAPVLERYEVHQYTVIATLLGNEYPRALVKLPDSEKGKVLIVKEKDRLGTNSGVIVAIERDGIKVRQTQKSPLGVVESNDILLRIVPGGKNANK